MYSFRIKTKKNILLYSIFFISYFTAGILLSSDMEETNKNKLPLANLKIQNFSPLFPIAHHTYPLCTNAELLCFERSTLITDDEIEINNKIDSELYEHRQKRNFYCAVCIIEALRQKKSKLTPEEIEPFNYHSRLRWEPHASDENHWAKKFICPRKEDTCKSFNKKRNFLSHFFHCHFQQ